VPLAPQPLASPPTPPLTEQIAATVATGAAAPAEVVSPARPRSERVLPPPDLAPAAAPAPLAVPTPEAAVTPAPRAFAPGERVIVEQNGSEVRAWLRVEDRTLGPVRVEVTRHEGGLQAVIQVAHAEVGALVRACEPEIRQALATQGSGPLQVSVQVTGEGGGQGASPQSSPSPEPQFVPGPAPAAAPPVAAAPPAPRSGPGHVEVWA
jgi:hypothetical protein